MDAFVSPESEYLGISVAAVARAAAGTAAARNMDARLTAAG